jgi:hypothetical protein
VAHIIGLGTQHAVPIGWAMAFPNLLSSRQMIFRKLPQKDSNFQRGRNFPDVFSMSNRSPLMHFLVWGVGRKDA